MAQMMSGIVRAAGIVIYRQLPPSNHVEYLLLQTSYGQHHWTPPKGHVDPGEDEWTTAKRETEEEAGLKVGSHLDVMQDFKVVCDYECTTKHKGRHNKRVTYFLAKLIGDSKVKLSDEHQDLKWLGLDDACILAQYKEMENVLRKCEERVTEKPNA